MNPSDAASTPSTEIAEPRRPVPEDFGTTEKTVGRFGRVMNDGFEHRLLLWLSLAAMLFGGGYFLPDRLVHPIAPFWLLIISSVAAFYVSVAIQEQIKRWFRKRPGYQAFQAYTAELTTYESAMRTYRHLVYQQKRCASRQQRQQRDKAMTEKLTRWKEIRGRDFEVEVLKILFSKGYDVSHPGSSMSGDGGVDFKIKFQEKTIIGQCKAHKNFISAGPVRDLYGTLIDAKADGAWLVCTTGFFRGAKSFASGKPIRLFTIQDILRLPDARESIAAIYFSSDEGSIFDYVASTPPLRTTGPT